MDGPADQHTVGTGIVTPSRLEAPLSNNAVPDQAEPWLPPEPTLGMHLD